MYVWLVADTEQLSTCSPNYSVFTTKIPLPNTAVVEAAILSNNIDENYDEEKT